MRVHPAHRRPAFTLLEVILALVLTVVLLTGVIAFYMAVLSARQEGVRYVADAKLDRFILDRLADEIRHATSIVPGDGIGFRGDRHEITIVRVGMPERYAYDVFNPERDTLPPAQLDLRRVTYQLTWDEELKDDEGVAICHGLWRTEQKTFDPRPKYIAAADAEPGEENVMPGAPPVTGELVAPEIKYIEFRYYDGADWRDRWQFSDEPMQVEQPEAPAGEEGDPAVPGGDAGSGDLEDLLSELNKADKKGSVTPRGPTDGGYALPQAVRITIGRIRVPREDDDFDLNQLEQMEERREQKYHEDRFTMVVPLIQSDKTLLSSRQYGVSDSMTRQEGGSSK